ncbi:MAG: FKBP-type peptidyl-prolyl cis-trans isomerase N-terminal domain-containing protein, partial [Candidatus Rokuibacteriota bacterium]
MFKSFALSAVLVLAVGAVAGAAGPELKTEDQKTLYALGLVISQNLGSFNLSAADLDSVLAGVSDGVLKKEYKVDVQTYAPKIQQLQASRAGATAVMEKKAGQAFLEKAAAEKGATRTASGLIITTLKPGTGPSPKATDKVKVHYHGTLSDGTVFDSSVQRGEPIAL